VKATLQLRAHQTFTVIQNFDQVSPGPSCASEGITGAAASRSDPTSDAMTAVTKLMADANLSPVSPLSLPNPDEFRY